VYSVQNQNFGYKIYFSRQKHSFLEIKKARKGEAMKNVRSKSVQSRYFILSVVLILCMLIGMINGVPFLSQASGHEEQLASKNVMAKITLDGKNPPAGKFQFELVDANGRGVDRTTNDAGGNIIFKGHKHIPTQSISEDAKNRTVAMYAPSKTFNLAGLVGSYHVIYNDALRDRVESKGMKPHYNAMNVMSMHALIGAYQEEGYEWLEELREVIEKNADYACDFIHREFDGVEVTKPEGTYMLFIDCSEFLKKHNLTLEQLEKRGWDVGVAWQDVLRRRLYPY